MIDKLKAWAALAGAVVTAVVQVLPDGPVRYWLTVASVVLTAVVVYVVPNVEGVNALQRKVAAAQAARRP